MKTNSIKNKDCEDHVEEAQTQTQNIPGLELRYEAFSYYIGLELV